MDDRTIALSLAVVGTLITLAAYHHARQFLISGEWYIAVPVFIAATGAMVVTLFLYLTAFSFFQ